MILMAIMFLVLMVLKHDQYFIISINEINGHEFSVIFALKFIFLFVMSISEIYNGDYFRFNVLMVRYLKGIKIVNSHYLPY